MIRECLPVKKRQQKKYRKTPRIDQARMIEAVAKDGQIQESVAEQNNAPRTILEALNQANK